MTTASYKNQTHMNGYINFNTLYTQGTGGHGDTSKVYSGGYTKKLIVKKTREKIASGEHLKDVVAVVNGKEKTIHHKGDVKYITIKKTVDHHQVIDVRGKSIVAFEMLLDMGLGELDGVLFYKVSGGKSAGSIAVCVDRLSACVELHIKGKSVFPIVNGKQVNNLDLALSRLKKAK